MSDDTTRMPPDPFAAQDRGPEEAGEPTKSYSGEPTRTFASAHPLPVVLDPSHPSWIGPYAILGVLGMGGMGIVYKARQDRPARLVALKVIRSGFHDAKLLRRFEMEGEAHGRLHHPGIAQIYEVGQITTPHGEQPFFAMEYIQGKPITAWVQEQKLDARARLALVASICDAVQHAHQRGVIHRDLKPDNILVDEAGQPKILDFGLARVTSPDLQRSTQLSLDGMVMGTLPYMAPEQASGKVEEIDTRCDIYALGVIAYELLSGRKPLDLKGQVVTEALRIIRESEPPRLSVILPLLRGDVETIVAKALEKDKERRYASASDLASDIRKHLSDQPIGARPASRLYVLGKFARRHKGVVAAAALVLAALLLGVTGTALGLSRAQSAEKISEQRRQTAEQALTREREQRAKVEEQTRLTTRNYGLALKESADIYFSRGEIHQGKVLLARASEILPGEFQTEFRLKNALLPELPRLPLPALLQPNGRSSFRCVSGDGRVAFLWESSRPVRLDMETESRTHFDALGPHALPLACSMNGELLVVSEQGKSSTLHLWDLRGTPRLVGSLTDDPSTYPNPPSSRNVLAFSPDGGELASWSPRRASLGLVVNRTSDFSRRISLPVPPSDNGYPFQVYHALRYSADGLLLAATRDQGIDLLSSRDLRRFKMLETQTGPNAVGSPCLDVDVSRDRQLFAIVFGSSPARVQLYDTDRFLRWNRLLPVEADRLVFLEGDRLLAYGGFNGSGVINVASGEILAHLPVPGILGASTNSTTLVAGGWRMDLRPLVGFNSPPDGGFQGELPLRRTLVLDKAPPALANFVAPRDDGRSKESLVMSEPDPQGKVAYSGWEKKVALFDPSSNTVRLVSTRLYFISWIQVVEMGQALLILGNSDERGLGNQCLERVDTVSGTSRLFAFPSGVRCHLPVVTRDDRVVLAVDTLKRVWGGDARAPETVSMVLPENSVREDVRVDPQNGNIRFRIKHWRYDTYDLAGVLDRPLPSYAEQVKRLGFRLEGIKAVWTDFRE